MKRYPKDRFGFVNALGRKIEPKEGDMYFRFEYRWKPKFPFVTRELVQYKMIKGIWLEIRQVPPSRRLYCFQCEFEMPYSVRMDGSKYCSNCGLLH